MPELISLTDLQIDLMRVLWTAGEATAIQVHREISKTHDLAQPTVATLLSRLEKKGAVDHRVEGRQFIYRAVLTESAVRRSTIAQLVDRLMGGNVPELIHQLLSERSVSADDLAQVKALIEQKERELLADARLEEEP
jgi:BlaI family transcriptional regulator, penicillinase repressor